MKYCSIFILLFFVSTLFSCKKDPVEETVLQFYYAYQNLEFEKAKEFCNPLMSYRLELIEQNFTEEKRTLVHNEIRKNHILIKEIEYDTSRTKVDVKIEFFHNFDKSYNAETVISLEKRNNQWQISNF